MEFERQYDEFTGKRGTPPGKEECLMWSTGWASVTPLVLQMYSGIILDHSIILLWIFDPESRIITRISVLDQPSRLVHQLVTSPLPDLHINRSTTVVWPTTNKMCIMFGSIGFWDLYCQWSLLVGRKSYS